MVLLSISSVQGPTSFLTLGMVIFPFALLLRGISGFTFHFWGRGICEIELFLGYYLGPEQLSLHLVCVLLT